MDFATLSQPYQALAPFFDLVFPTEEFADVFARAIPEILRQLNTTEDLRILDLCCGTGRALSLFSEVRGAQFHGIDANARMLSEARRKFAKRGKTRRFSKAHFSNIDIRRLSSKHFKSTYHLALMTGVSIQHFSRTERLRILKCVFDALDSNGLFVFDVLKTSKQLDSEHPQAIAKRTIHLKDRIIKVFYLRWFDSGRAFHHNIVVELPSGTRKHPTAHHDFFEFHPLDPNSASDEAASVGFRRVDDIAIEQPTTTFLCLRKPGCLRT
jgi:SAM-dependent methyltransferase